MCESIEFAYSDNTSCSLTSAFIYSFFACFALINNPFSPIVKLIAIPASIINITIVIARDIKVIPLLNFSYSFFH